MTKDDVLFGCRLQRSPSRAHERLDGVPDVRCAPLDVLRLEAPGRPPRPGDAPAASAPPPTDAHALAKMIEERIVSFSIAHPGLGPKRIASQLAREKWGAIIVSPNGVWKVLCRHGLNTRAKRLGLIAGSAAPTSRHVITALSSTLTSTGPVNWSALTVSTSASAPHRGRDLAAIGDRRLLIVCVGRARDRQEGQPDRAPDQRFVLAAAPSLACAA
jgi:hypothetical protein